MIPSELTSFTDHNRQWCVTLAEDNIGNPGQFAEQSERRLITVAESCPSSSCIVVKTADSLDAANITESLVSGP